MKIHHNIPHKEDTPIENTSHRVEESTNYNPEIAYTISQEEVNTFRIITIEYTWKIRELPLTPLFPRRRRMVNLLCPHQHILSYT